MDFSLNTPALLFPAITLLMLAYTTRFLALAKLIRDLHQRYQLEPKGKRLVADQIKNLRKRLQLIKFMQAFGIGSFFFCVLSMIYQYLEHTSIAFLIFGLSLILLLCSLFLSLYEILISTRALEIELNDMAELID